MHSKNDTCQKKLSNTYQRISKYANVNHWINRDKGCNKTTCFLHADVPMNVKKTVQLISIKKRASPLKTTLCTDTPTATKEVNNRWLS